MQPRLKNGIWGVLLSAVFVGFLLLIVLAALQTGDQTAPPGSGGAKAPAPGAPAPRYEASVAREPDQPPRATPASRPKAAVAEAADPVRVPANGVPPPTPDTSGPPARPEPPRAAPPLAPDVFGPLRAASTGRKGCEPDWGRVAADLRRLKTLRGAAVDPETGQVVFCGASSPEPGPFRVEDFLVALRAAFFELEVPGMTIDENPHDKSGPIMHVRYFGGTSNTHLGLVMFEVDRLMKCFGQGADNITKRPLRPQYEGFVTQAEIARALDDLQGGPVWSRFWANLATGRFPTNDLRGKVVLEPSRDGRTVSFAEHRIWIDTEQMYDPGPGRRLVSSGGVRSPSAERFADRLTADYEKIAAEFPVFRELHELSKLVVVAEWLRESDAPFDPELLYYEVEARTKTPPTTPSLSTTNSWTNGLAVNSIEMLGGVSLDGTPRYGSPVDPAKRKADAFADAFTRYRSELRSGRAVPIPGDDEAPQWAIPLGPPARAPPSTQPLALGPREPSRFLEVQGRLQPVSRELEDPVLGKHELPLWTDASTGRDMLDLPILRACFSPRRRQTATITSSSGFKATVEIPDRLYLTSPSRDISVQFQTEPAFDETRREVFFPARTAPGVKGYYPGSRTVRLENGTEYRFNEAGLPEHVRGPGMPNLAIEHTAYRDGPCIQTQAGPATLPRAPPRDPTLGMESRSRAPVISRELDAPRLDLPFQAAVRPDGQALPQLPALEAAPSPGREPLPIESPSTVATLPRGPPRDPALVLESRSRPPSVSRELEAPGPDTVTRAVIRNADAARSLEVRDQQGYLSFVTR